MDTNGSFYHDGTTYTGASLGVVTPGAVLSPTGGSFYISGQLSAWTPAAPVSSGTGTLNFSTIFDTDLYALFEDI